MRPRCTAVCREDQGGPAPQRQARREGLGLNQGPSWAAVPGTLGPVVDRAEGELASFCRAFAAF